MDRRAFLQDTAAGAVALALPDRTRITHGDDLSPVFAQVEKRHDEAVQRLQEWIRQPSIAAEHRGMDEGCELTMRLLRDRKSTRLNSSHTVISYAVFCLKKKKKQMTKRITRLVTD